MVSFIDHKTGDARRESKPLPPVIIAMGDKGGVGHSFAARVAAGLLCSSGYSIVGIDGDKRNAHLFRFYSNSMPVQRASLRTTDGWADFYATIEQIPSNSIIIVDLPGNIGDILEEEKDRFQMMMTAFGRGIICLWVAAEEEDSIRLFERTKQLAPATHTLFVLNGRFAPNAESFELWQESNSRKRFLAEGGTEVFMPVLQIRPRTKIARTRSPFNDVSNAGLMTSEATDYGIWWRMTQRAFSPLLSMVERLS